MLALGIQANRFRKSPPHLGREMLIATLQAWRIRLREGIATAPTWIIRHRKVFILVATVFALRWMARTANLLEPGTNIANQRLSVVYFVAGMLAIGLVALLTWRSLAPALVTQSPLTPVHSNWILAILGGLALLALAESNGHLLGIERLNLLTGIQQIALLAGGTALLVWGLGGGGLPRRLPKIDVLELVAVTLIVALALYLRVRDLDTAVRIFVDELNFGTFATYFKNNDAMPLLHPEVRGFPSIYSYFQWQTMQQWGRDLTGFRIPSALFGTLTIPALYILARSLFDKKTALIAAAFLAVFPPHVHHSRLALNNIADPAFGTLAFAFLARGLRTNRRVDFALGGAFLGLTQYFYEGGRLLYPPLAVAWLAFGFIFWRPRPALKGVLIAALAAILVAMPIYYVLYSLDAPMTVRFESEGRDNLDLTSEEKTDTYLWHLKYSFLFYTTQPEWISFYYGGRDGMVLTYLLPACLLGAAFLFWRFYTPAVLVIGWILAVSLANSFLRINVLTTRYVVVFPAIALLMAVGVRYTADWLWQARLSHRYQNIVLALIVGLMVVAQIDYYWGRHLTVYNQQLRIRWPYDGEDAMLRTADFPSGTYIYVFSRWAIEPGYAVGIVAFLHEARTVRVLPRETVTAKVLNEVLPGAPAAFFLEPGDFRSLRLLKSQFPALRGPFLSSNTEFPKERQLVLYYVPPSDPP